MSEAKPFRKMRKRHSGDYGVFIGSIGHRRLDERWSPNNLDDVFACLHQLLGHHAAFP